MAVNKNIARDINKPIDEYLKFLQQHFNTSGNSKEYFKTISDGLTAISNNINYPNEIRTTASKLSNNLKHIKIITDFNKYTKFNKLANTINNDIKSVYSVSDDIIKDINVARNWLDSYESFSKLINKLGFKHTKLELQVLAQSILGRAIELCPMDTGTLRKSAVLIVTDNFIRIIFLAPYAVYVHENMEIAHPIHGGRDCGGRAKFLELAIQEFLPNKLIVINIDTGGEVYYDLTFSDLDR